MALLHVHYNALPLLKFLDISFVFITSRRHFIEFLDMKLKF